MADCECSVPSSSDTRLIKEELDRRNFLIKSGTGLLGFCLADQIWPSMVKAAQPKRIPRGTARFCVFVELRAGPATWTPST